MGNASSHPEDGREGYQARSFPGSAIVDSLTAPCGNLRDTVVEGDSPKNPHTSGFSKFLNQAEALCVQSPSSDTGNGGYSDFDDEYEDFRKDKENVDANNHHNNNNNNSDYDDDDDSIVQREQQQQQQQQQQFRSPVSPANPTAALFARALVSEVTDNPKTMTPAAMAEREMKLLKAQHRATNMSAARKGNGPADPSRPVGVPGGVGQPSVLGSIAHALTGSTDPLAAAQAQAAQMRASVLPPNSMSENRAQVDSNGAAAAVDVAPPGKYTITIGLSLSRRSSVGHTDTVTRQTAFDFNELQDREYKYVSSTDSSGWRAGGGERGGPQSPLNGASTPGGGPGPMDPGAAPDESDFGFNIKPLGAGTTAPGTPTGASHKAAAPDTVHIPIIHIDAESPQAIDAIIAALARGEIFIPHMAITPEALSVDGVSPPDLLVRFGTERNDDLPPDEWPNWCLEFMHNQIYEYFQGMGARWMKRPFSITLAKKVRWKTVKHMNRYFAHAERVIDAWREKGPQYLDPQLAYIEGGATPEEVARPHGIYLLRNGVPTNYFAPNFDPPYTTKMTRSLLLNVMDKSWDKKRREWTSEPVPRLVTPAMLVTAMCGCGDHNAGGFIANEVTLKNKIDTSTIPDRAVIVSKDPAPAPATRPAQKSPPRQKQSVSQPPPQQQQQQQKQQPPLQTQQSSPPQQQQQQQQPSDSKMQPQTPAGTEAADTDIVSEPAAQYASKHGRERKRSNTETSEDTNDPMSPTNASETPSSYQHLHLQVTHSSADAPKSQVSTALSPQYGSAPKPEFSPRSAVTKFRGSSEDPAGTVQGVDPSVAGAPVDPNSDYVQQPSVAGSTSTIMHMNLSAEKFMKRELERHTARDEKKEEEDPRTLASDEDWLDELGRPLPSPAVTGPDFGTQSEKDKVKEALENERARQIALIAMVQEQSSKGQEQMIKNLRNDSGKMDLAKAVIKADKQTKRSSAKDSPGINKNNSGVSLEYSVDSTYMGDGSTLGGSSILGGKYATDGSTASSKGTGMTANGSSQKKDPLAMPGTQENFSKDREDDEVSGFSLQESTSSVEIVPTDEELFAVGWAKALDPKSGSYYYFTLDRTKIVWDNPLATRGASADSTSAGSLTQGGVAI